MSNLRRAGSWMLTSPSGRVVETFDPAFARYAAARGYCVETAAEYLGRINAAYALHNRKP